jgi:hypothetical protein
MFCREQVARLIPRVDELRAAGAAVHVVGCGEVAHLNWFIEDMKPDFDGNWTDLGRTTYDAAGLIRGRLATLGPAAVKQSWRARKAGARQAGIKGDTWQQGGVWIVRPDGSVPWTYANDNAGDHASPDDILSALDAVG